MEPPETGVGKPFPTRGCYNGRYFALRSLGLLSDGEPATWARYAAALEAARLRKLAATIGFAHQPRGFAAPALRRLAATAARAWLDRAVERSMVAGARSSDPSC